MRQRIGPVAATDRQGTRSTLGIAILAALLIAASVILVAAEPADAATTLPDFEDQLVTTSIGNPIALDFTPDGRMLVASRGGRLFVFQNGTASVALNISAKLCINAERGLLGVAVDPNFSTNHYVYLFYTYNKFGTCPLSSPTDTTNPVNRVSRFVMSGGTADPSSEMVLIDNMPSPGQHNAGDLHFGNDGYLYVSVGDGGCDYAGDSGCLGANDASRDPNILLGKILRITRDGGIPSGNPYSGTSSARCNITGRTSPGMSCQETFASGLRNPFRFAIDPDRPGARFLVGDVGQNDWEELDEGISGADYGWNFCEGGHNNRFRPSSVDCSATSPYTPPVFEYNHASTGCSSITAQAFVPDGVWPSAYDGSYLFGDYVCNKIFELRPTGGGSFAMNEFASELGAAGPIAMVFGPNGSGEALYYTTFANGGEVHRIVYTGGGSSAPDAVLNADPTSGSPPLAVSFDASGSRDPDPGDTLAYVWDFGDGSPIVETTGPNTNHTYTGVDVYTATLIVRDSSGTEDTATILIDTTNDMPTPSISSPALNKLFKVGEQISLQGSATDSQDGQLPGGSLSWEIRRWHNNSHWHPWFSGVGNNLTFTAPPPEDLEATGPGNYLEIRLTATDSKGLASTVTRDLQPHRVDVTFGSQPTGAQLQLNGLAFTTPRAFTSWEGYVLTAFAPSPQTIGGTSYTFGAWSDGGPQTHNIPSPGSPSTYTATYNVSSCTITGTPANDILTGTAGDDIICGGGGNDTISGMGGDDVLKGEGGADKLLGGPGKDLLDGGNGLDKANFSEAPSPVTASLASNTATGDGSDTLSAIENLVGSSFNDVLTGSTANNTINGGAGMDTIVGGGGADQLIGGQSSDTVYGGSGNDSLIGGIGVDRLFGEDGDDTVNSQDGVSGNDTLDGGPHVIGDTAITDATEKSIVGFP
jgi:glucose/arabinose dehydrogenase/Ca2+-binding RTX toxin-like protein